MKDKVKFLSVVIAGVLVGSATVFAAKDIIWTTVDGKNALRDGNSESAMERARQIARWGVEHNWNGTIPAELRRLPDQSLAEDPSARGSVSFGLVSPKMKSRVKFSSFTYARHNTIVSSTGRSTRPEGFVIVGFADGRVEKVPVDALTFGKVDGKMMLRFPGDEGYDPNGIKMYPTQANGPQQWPKNKPKPF